MASIRRPAVSGQFYEGHSLSLKTQIEECFTHALGPGRMPKIDEKGKREIIGIISPHAGYMYSGPVAAQGFFQLAKDGSPKTFIILGPNHRGMGAKVSIFNSGSWQTPLGVIEINLELSQEIIENSDIIKPDKSAHNYEHSIEVQLPFLQYIYGEQFNFVPLCMSDQGVDTSKLVGETLGEVLKDKDVVLIASSDFTHYESQKNAEKKDKLAIDAILKLNVLDFYESIKEQNISICGHGPIAVAINVAKKLGAKSCELLKYATSGDITHSYHQVVAYAAIKITK